MEISSSLTSPFCWNQLWRLSLLLLILHLICDKGDGGSDSVLKLHSVRAATGNDLASDAKALRSFMSAVGHSASRVNWPSSGDDPCSWHGVSCSSGNINVGRRVLSLRLPGVGLWGTVPSGTIGLLSELRILSLRSNKLSGPLPVDLSNCTQLRSLFLQHNSLTGPLPLLSSSMAIVRLNLAYNNFSSSIPQSYRLLHRLATLYLQSNAISGSLPDFSELANLAQFNVSSNRLNGSVPSSLQTRFGISAFLDNHFCGKPLFSLCNNSTVAAPAPSPEQQVAAAQHSARHWRTLYIIVIAVGVAALLFFIVALLLVLSLRRRSLAPRSDIAAQQTTAASAETKEKSGSATSTSYKEDQYLSSAGAPEMDVESNKLVFFEGSHYAFDLEDLLRASAEVLGKGSVGTSYKAVLEDGATVVVKRLKDVSVGKKDFEQHMQLLGSLRHSHIVPLRAYYFSKDEKLLLYDFMPLGSLSALLHGDKGSSRSTLDWDTRLKIVSGVAKGITYLHEHSASGKLAHCNIKSSNVLLSTDFEASISDYGLAPLFGSSLVASRIVGYRAPELVETRKFSPKADVYSFGVLLLEILTGKAPKQTSNGDGIDLPRWVQSVVREEWTAEVFDVELMRYQNIEEEMVQILQIAMACVAALPDQRPSMAQVVKMIEDVRAFETDDGNGGTRLSSSDKSRESNGNTPQRSA